MSSYDSYAEVRSLDFNAEPTQIICNEYDEGAPLAIVMEETTQHLDDTSFHFQNDQCRGVPESRALSVSARSCRTTPLQTGGSRWRWVVFGTWTWRRQCRRRLFQAGRRRGSGVCGQTRHQSLASGMKEIGTFLLRKVGPAAM